MKIACDSCGAKYTIADEKVSGKTVKIRCKKCGATMVIDGHAAASAKGVAPIAPQGVESAQPTWMIHSGEGAQETVTTEQIVERYREGRLDGSAYVWREGMADWKLLRDVNELFSLCVSSVAGAAAPAPAASRPVESARRASQPPPASAPESARTAAVAPPAANVPAALPSPGPLSDLVAQSATPSTAPQPPGALTGQRNDNSVLFSLASLSQGGPQGAAPQAPGSDQSGLIDMRALAQLAPKPAASGPKVDDIMNLSAGGLFGGGAVSPVMTQTYQAVQAPLGAAAVPAQAGGISPKTLGLAIVGGALFVVAIGAGVFVATRKAPEPASPVAAAQAPAATAPVVAEPAAAPAAPAASGAVAPAPEAAKDEPAKPTAKVAPAAAGAAPAAPAAPKAAAPAPSGKGGVSSAAAAAALFGPGGAASAPAPKPAPAATPASLESAMLGAASKGSAAPAAAPKPAPAAAASGAAFDRGAAAAELRRITESVGSCRRPAGPNGDGHVTVTFRNDGAVDHVEVDRPPYQGTPVGACVASKFKLARVPAFGGAPITVGKSFTID